MAPRKYKVIAVPIPQIPRLNLTQFTLLIGAVVFALGFTGYIIGDIREPQAPPPPLEPIVAVVTSTPLPVTIITITPLPPATMTSAPVYVAPTDAPIVAQSCASTDRSSGRICGSAARSTTGRSGDASCTRYERQRGIRAGPARRCQRASSGSGMVQRLHIHDDQVGE